MTDDVRLRLDVARRTRLAADVLAHLTTALPGSHARLRGSLADGRADEATGLLARAEARIGLVAPGSELHDRIGRLIDTVAERDSIMTPFATEIRHLATQVFQPFSNDSS